MTKAITLLADDDLDFLSTRAEILENSGYHVIKAGNPDDTRARLAEGKIHIAVIDLRLTPGKPEIWSGLDVAKEYAHKVPVIILAESPTAEMVRAALASDASGVAPAVNFIINKYDDKELLGRLESLLSVILVQPPHVASALLVGVNAYTYGIEPLSYCVKDADILGATLDSSYRTKIVLNGSSEPLRPTYTNIIAELSTLCRSADKEGLLLFYFSGHGFATNGRSYLVPCDARLHELARTAIPTRTVVELMQASRARVKVIILDACASGLNVGKSVNLIPKFYEHLYAHTRGIVTLASCRQDQLSYESDSLGHSRFTYFLINALKGDADGSHKGFVTIMEVFHYLAAYVPDYNDQSWLTKQTPTVQIETDGEVILNFYRTPVDGTTPGPE